MSNVVANVAKLVVVLIRMVGVVYVRAVVARIAVSIAVPVQLVRVVVRDAVVACVAPAIDINIGLAGVFDLVAVVAGVRGAIPSAAKSLDTAEPSPVGWLVVKSSPLALLRYLENGT